MKDNVYLLVTDPNNPCRDVIRSRDTGLRIYVYCLDKEKFTPNPDEIQLYGDDHGELRAFETAGITADDALDVASAIRWYADYLDYPQMEILAEDPRENDGSIQGITG
jgi:hypothetical protein